MRLDRDGYGIHFDAGPVSIEIVRSGSAHLWAGSRGVHIFLRPNGCRAIEFDRVPNWRKKIDVTRKW